MIAMMYRVKHLDGREDIYCHKDEVLTNETANCCVKSGCDLNYVDRLFMSMQAAVLEKIAVSVPEKEKQGATNADHV